MKLLPKQTGAFPFVSSISAHAVTYPAFGRTGPGRPVWTSNLVYFLPFTRESPLKNSIYGAYKGQIRFQIPLLCVGDRPRAMN